MKLHALDEDFSCITTLLNSIDPRKKELAYIALASALCNAVSLKSILEDVLGDIIVKTVKDAYTINDFIIIDIDLVMMYFRKLIRARIKIIKGLNSIPTIAYDSGTINTFMNSDISEMDSFKRMCSVTTSLLNTIFNTDVERTTSVAQIC